MKGWISKDISKSVAQRIVVINFLRIPALYAVRALTGLLKYVFPARRGLAGQAEVVTELICVGPVRKAHEALRARGQFGTAGEQEGWHRRRRHGDAAAPALIAFQDGQFGARDGAVGAGTALL